MKKYQNFYLKIFILFGGNIFNIFEYACFRNDLACLRNEHARMRCLIIIFAVHLKIDLGYYRQRRFRDSLTDLLLRWTPCHNVFFFSLSTTVTYLIMYLLISVILGGY